MKSTAVIPEFSYPESSIFYVFISVSCKYDGENHGDIGPNHLLENNLVGNCGENAYDLTAGSHITLRNCERYGCNEIDVKFNEVKLIVVKKIVLLLIISVLLCSSTAISQISAFPGAEGHGALSIGGKLIR